MQDSTHCLLPFSNNKMQEWEAASQHTENNPSASAEDLNVSIAYGSENGHQQFHAALIFKSAQ